MLKVSIRDVADRANVSRATVSRVINNNPTVNDEIRTRVLDAIHSLGYQPNRAARRLRKRSRDVIGVIISDIQNPYFISVIRGIEDAAYIHRMNIVLCNSDEDSTKLQKYLQLMQAEAVAGLIIAPTSTNSDKILNKLGLEDIPIILIDRAINNNLNYDVVKVDNVDGAYRGVKHLIDLGYNRIGIIHPLVTTGYERYQGYQKALTEAGLTLDPALVKVADFDAESSYRLARELIMDTSPPPDAIFTATNLMTLGALRAIRQRGMRVPEDVALVGFDDIPWAEELYSPLTAVAQPTYELGQEAVRMLLRRLDQPTIAFHTSVLKTQLIVRESCGSLLRQKAIIQFPITGH